MLRQQQSAALVIMVSEQTLASARRSIHACDSCSPNAQICFAHLLDRLVGHFGEEREYVVTEDLLCPVCVSPIASDTLVEVVWNMKAAEKACA